MINTNHIMPVQMFLLEQQEIVSQLNRSTKMVEWGSGGSTLLWYMNLRSDQQLVSIENDAHWAERVQAVIATEQHKGNRRNFEYCVYPTEQDGATFTPEHSYYEPYVMGPAGIWDADLYLVDGRVRLWCARNIFERAENRSAVIYCHDYAYNEGWYNELLKIYPRHQVIETPLDSDPTNVELRHYSENCRPKLLKLWLSDV